MQAGEHAAKGGEIAARRELKKFHQQIGARGTRAVPQGFRRRAAGAAQRGEPVGFGGKSGGKACLVHLDEYQAALERRAIAPMDAAAADRLGVGDAEVFEDQPEVSRVLARFRRSTRMPMKARSNLLRHETLACSRSATRMRRMRESAPAATVAPRVWPLSER